MHLLKSAVAASLGLTLALTLAVASQAQTKLAANEAHSPWIKTHRVVIQVSQNDPAIMNLALNNAENLVNYYKEKGEKIEIEFVAFGAGLSMMRNDTSPVKNRLAEFAKSMKNVTFTGCGNTLANQSKQENKNITLVPEARIVPAGIARIVELEEQGWTYVRP
jgi:uncharacterized protein